MNIMKTSMRLPAWILILLLQACMPIINQEYYVPYGEGASVTKGATNYLTSTIGGKVILETHLIADYGSGALSDIYLSVIFRVPDGVHIKLASSQFILESKSLDAPVTLKAQEYESDLYGPNKGRKYEITDELHGYTVIIGEFKPLQQTLHAWYRVNIPIEQHDLSIVTVKFPDIEINGQIYNIAPVRFERNVGTFWYQMNR
jgi:hypothetical protein